jgi:hypothetical protein
MIKGLYRFFDRLDEANPYVGGGFRLVLPDNL